jgi:hypothetical protein
MKTALCLAAALCAITGFATAQEKKPKADAKPAAESKPAAGEKTTDVQLGSLTFKVPGSWEAKKKLRMFSKAGYTIPDKGKADGIEADLYHFEGELGGGDVQSNIARWQGQFKAGDDGKAPEPKKEELTFGDKKALLVTLKGTFISGSVSDAERPLKEGYTMAGVIIETGDGKAILKFTGPDAAMTAALPEIKKLVGSAFPAAK